MLSHYNLNKNSINTVNPVYKNLYGIIYIGDYEINKMTYETFDFKIEGDLCIVRINDAYHIKLENFKKIKYIITSVFDKSGAIIKFFKIKVNLDKFLYELNWTATSLSEITIYFNIEKIETYTPEDNINISSICRETIREIKLNNILDLKY
jgi:hypothetical protein